MSMEYLEANPFGSNTFQQTPNDHDFFKNTNANINMNNNNNNNLSFLPSWLTQGNDSMNMSNMGPTGLTRNRSDDFLNSTATAIPNSNNTTNNNNGVGFSSFADALLGGSTHQTDEGLSEFGFHSLGLPIPFIPDLPPLVQSQESNNTSNNNNTVNSGLSFDNTNVIGSLLPSPQDEQMQLNMDAPNTNTNTNINTNASYQSSLENNPRKRTRQNEPDRSYQSPPLASPHSIFEEDYSSVNSSPSPVQQYSSPLTSQRPSPSSLSTTLITTASKPSRRTASSSSSISAVSASASTSTSTSTAASSRRGRKSTTAAPPPPPPPPPSHVTDSDTDVALDKETEKKIKHQLTDRQRRAKIKEGMDELRKLVSDENSTAKPDQATIVLKSVDMVKDLKSEVAELRAKLKEMELREQEERDNLRMNALLVNTTTPLTSAANPHSPVPGAGLFQVNRANYSSYMASPISGLMSSLNAAGVSMWRIGLTGKVLEVNLVFEMISGFQNAQLVGRSPCQPPLNGSLSIMPASFLRLFASVEIAPPSSAGTDGLSPTSGSPTSPASYASPLSPESQTSADETVQSPQTKNIVSMTAAQHNMSEEELEYHLTPAFQASIAASTFNGNQAPLFSVSLSDLPLIPDSEIKSFFPKYLSPQHCIFMNDSVEARKYGSNMPDVSMPQPHGSYLVNHLAQLPPNHALKLLSRHATAYGDVLESVSTLCLVRDSKGHPEFMLCLTTPDSRRLLKRPVTDPQLKPNLDRPLSSDSVAM